MTRSDSPRDIDVESGPVDALTDAERLVCRVCEDGDVGPTGTCGSCGVQMGPDGPDPDDARDEARDMEWDR